MKFRALRADEIKVRVDRITKKGVMLLLYKDARVDMDILDETVGPENWQRKHYENKKNLYCSVGINVNYEKLEAAPLWVWKDDVGAESYTEKEKGESSDSFKRACVNWGIGRELYTAPNIFISCKTKQKEGGKGYELEKPFQFSKVYVCKVESEECNRGRIIKTLALADEYGNIVYSNVGKSVKPIDPEEPTYEAPKLDDRIDLIHKEAIEKRITNLGKNVLTICEYYRIKDLSEMTNAQLSDCNAQLNKIEDKLEKEAKKREKQKDKGDFMTV